MHTTKTVSPHTALPRSSPLVLLAVAALALALVIGPSRAQQDGGGGEASPPPEPSFFASTLLDALNEAREARGLAPLCFNAKLLRSAQNISTELLRPCTPAQVTNGTCPSLTEGEVIRVLFVNAWVSRSVQLLTQASALPFTVESLDDENNPVVARLANLSASGLIAGAGNANASGVLLEPDRRLVGIGAALKQRGAGADADAAATAAAGAGTNLYVTLLTGVDEGESCIGAGTVASARGPAPTSTPTSSPSSTALVSPSPSVSPSPLPSPSVSAPVATATEPPSPTTTATVSPSPTTTTAAPTSPIEANALDPAETTG